MSPDTITAIGAMSGITAGIAGTYGMIIREMKVNPDDRVRQRSLLILFTILIALLTIVVYMRGVPGDGLSFADLKQSPGVLFLLLLFSILAIFSRYWKPRTA